MTTLICMVCYWLLQIMNEISPCFLKFFNYLYNYFFKIEILTILFRFGLLYVPFFSIKMQLNSCIQKFCTVFFSWCIFEQHWNVSPLLLKWFFCILKKVDHMCRCKKKMIVCKNCSSIANSKSNYCFLYLYINLVVLQWNWPQNGIINSQISLWWQRWYKKKCNFCTKSNSSSKMNFFQTSHF